MNELLSDFIKPVPRYARASNLERDADNDVVADYHLIDPGLGVLSRLLRSRVSAMVVTGPYGSGKSTFALFLDALLGPSDREVPDAARAKLEAAEPALASALAEYLAQVPGTGGPVRAIATGRPEPLPATVARALRLGVDRHSHLTPSLRERVHRVTGSEASAASIAELYREVSIHAPVCLIIDELGLVLEATLEEDLWLLQELGESAARGSSIGRGFVLGLQHRSLAEQISGGGPVPAGWRKVQGRFEEVAFVESRDAVFSLIPRVLQRDAPPPLELAIAERAESLSRRVEALGLGTYLPGGASALAAAYPLDPGVLLVLPDLTSFYGQRERTLLAFLAGGEPGSVRTLLETHSADERPLPSVSLPDVYEFFVASGSHRLGPAARVSRWAEVERRIREVGSLSQAEGAVARAVALLNLVGRGGAARASEAVIAMCVPDASAALAELLRRGLVTYRSTTDEFRIWEGSDLDLESGLARYTALAAGRPLADLLNGVAPMGPVVATAHSEATGVLRSFEQVFFAGRVLPEGSHDGLIAYRVDDAVHARSSGHLPVVVLTGSNLDEVRKRALETQALAEMAADDQVVRDWVALREVRDRYALSLDALRGLLDESFRPTVAQPSLVLDDISRSLDPATLPRLASDAADAAFPDTPFVANEMFGVHELTSQGARARSLLFAAMIENPGEPHLGLSGWGPERALYEAALGETGIHDRDSGSFHAGSDGRYAAVWEKIAGVMRSAIAEPVDVETVLASVEGRPFGLRRSLTPVIWLAVMLNEVNELGLFERGTFVARLGPDVLDRIVKAPTTFTVRHFAVRGARKGYLHQLAGLAFPGQGDPSVVAVVRGLVQFVRHLPPSLLATRQISDEAGAVRDAILTTREPDALLFERLPAALGAPAVSPTGAYPTDLPSRLAGALSELSGWHRLLLGRTYSELADAFDFPAESTMRADLRQQSTPILKYVIEPSLKGFLGALADTSRELDDDWLGAVVVAAGLPPITDWSDQDPNLFRLRVRELARAQRRVFMLHSEIWARELSEGFLARRVTVTEPDGSETSRMVWYDEGTADHLAKILDSVLADAERKVGRGAGRMLLALLAERLGIEERTTDENDRVDARRAG
jgi:CheY-like chemotaxis protein/energy-coupling factor transporter ATP-binding protein EcfA2